MFSPKIPRPFTAYNIVIQEKTAFFVQMFTFVFSFAKIFNVVFILLPHLFCLFGLCISKTWLLVKVLQKLELSPSHTCLTSLQNDCDGNQTIYLIVKNITHTHYKFIQKSPINRLQVNFQSAFQKDVC